MDELEKIWKKYLMKNATKEERAQLLNFLNDDEQEPKINELLNKEWEEAKEADLATESNLTLLGSIKKEMHTEQIPPSTSKVIKLRGIYRYIAAACLAGVIGLSGWFVWQQTVNVPYPSALIVDTGEYARQFELPDGSMVWLNAATTLKYARNFEENRKVFLSGEAYFKVKKDSLHPFIVNAEGINTRVLGTAFNISAYPDFTEVKVALEEGKVAIEKPSQRDSLLKILDPKEEFIYSKNQASFQTKIFDQNNPYVWTNDIILFDGASVQEVIKVLKKHYKVKFKIENSQSMTTQLVHRIDKNKDTLDEILKDIAVLSDYRFVRQGKNRIRVLPKTKK